jgi:TetR/AcrR family transcriptional repressor of lmrAB and yxaGH operons
MLDAAITLMRQSGLSGAGINRIVAHSRAPKGSMYYYFPGGKIELTAEALRLYGNRVADHFEKALSSKRAPDAKVRALFAHIAHRLEQGNFNQSCAAGAVTLDLEPGLEALRPVVAEVMASWQAVVARHIPMRSQRRAIAFAGLILSAIEGGYIRGRAERSARAFLDAGELLAELARSEQAKKDG